MATPEQLANALRRADAAGDVDAAKKLAAALRAAQGPQMGAGDQAMDLVKSAGAGIGQGFGALAGLPGDISSLTQSGMDWLMQPDEQTKAKMAQYGTSGPTSQQVLGAVNDATRPAPDVSQLVTGQQPRAPLEYEPKTTAGKYARSVGQMAPSMLGGPGSAAMRVASGVGAGAVSEGLGQVAENYAPAAEPYARIAGALVGGGIPLLKNIGTKQTLPSTQELRQSADAAYKTAENSGVVIPAQAYTQIVNRIGQMAVDEGAGRMTPNIKSAMQELVANEGRDLTVKEIDRMRQNLRFGIDNMKPDEARIIRNMIREFDAAVEQLGPTQLADARKKYSTFKKAEKLDELERRAELTSQQFSQSGMENARRSEYRNLAKSKKIRQFNPDEQAAIEGVAKGSKTANIARFVGKMAPRGPVSMIPALAGMHLGGLPGAMAGIGIPAAGEIGRQLATRLGEGRARVVQELVRTGSRASSSARKQKQIDAIARALLQSQGANP